MIRLCRPSSVLIVLFAAFPLVAAEPKTELKVVTNRPEALYGAGEPVEFVITAIRDGKPLEAGKAAYLLDNDGVGTLGKGEAEVVQGKAVVRGSLDKPGFLRCQVTLRGEKKPLVAVAAAGIDVEKIPPSLPVPDDFDRFWTAQKQKLAAVPIKAEQTPVKSPVEGVECFDVQVTCLGKPVSGYFARPASAKPKSLPAILHVHGAGVRGSSLAGAAGWAKRGMLSMDINAHGIPNGKPAEFYENLTRGELKDYRFAGRDDREKCYFLGMFLRLIRAIDFLASRPEWDGKTVVVQGHSQGGGQSIAAAGLDSRVTFIAAGVPAICDHSGRAAGRINGWPRLVPTDSSGKPDPVVLEVARYFDCMNLATRAKAGAILSVGFVDSVCPPTSVYAAYNNLLGKRSMLIEPLMGHAAPPKITEAFRKAIEKHLDEQK